MNRGDVDHSYEVRHRKSFDIPFVAIRFIYLRTGLYLERQPDPAGPYARLIRFVADRPGHDFRYEIDPSQTQATLGWTAAHDFTAGLSRTIDWYLAHRSWWEGVRTARYAGERLGTAA